MDIQNKERAEELLEIMNKGNYFTKLKPEDNAENSFTVTLKEGNELSPKVFKDKVEKAGFFMLPTGKKDNSTALQTVLYSFWLLVASLIPAFGYTGNLFLSPIAAGLVFLLGVWMIFYAIKLYQIRTAKAARTLMLVSVSYISLLQIVYIVDKFLR